LTSLRFLGGVGEIGGNKILLSDRGSNVFLDFGKSYAQEGEYFDFPLLQPREPRHLLGLGILPNVTGLYKGQEDDHDVDAIVLSHPHGDHWDYMRFVKDDVPIHCAPLTAKVILAREMSSAGGISSDYKVANLTGSRGRQISKTFEDIVPETSHSVGEIQIKSYEVDHSIPGCYGMIIGTSEGTVVYTGDVRVAGPRRLLTEEFVKQSAAAEPEVLIVEGTNVGEASISSEDEVKAKAGVIVGSTSQLVVASFAAGDTQRINTFLTVAKESGRKFALSMKQAFMLTELQGDSSYAGPSLDDKDILIFRKDKKTEREFEKEVGERFGDRVVDSTDVNQMQDKVILAASLLDFNELFELDPKPGSVFILSQSEPFNEEMEIDHRKLGNWLDRYGLPLYQAHASGHAKPHELKWLIKTIHPKKAYLIHTEHPVLYQRYLADLGIETVVPAPGSEFTL
jgi:ribonuclease J